MPRLYVIVRQDLSPGLQAAQAVHAAIGFALKHPGLLAETVILVGVPCEPDLEEVLRWLTGRAHFAVREPDLSGSLTAIAVEPAAGDLCRGLPLLLREALTPVAQ